jgi:hypothetical protein
MTLPSSELRERIAQIFRIRRTYTLTEVANILGVDLDSLVTEVAARDIAAAEGDIHQLPWKEVAYLALRTWPLQVIFDALGPDAGSCLPELLRPTTITVTLPTYQVRAIEVLARDQRLDVSTFVQLHLLDLVSAESPFLAEQIPGFLAAFHFPFGEER